MYIINVAPYAGSPSSVQGLMSPLSAMVVGGGNVVGGPAQQLPVTQQEVAIELWHGGRPL